MPPLRTHVSSTYGVVCAWLCLGLMSPPSAEALFGFEPRVGGTGKKGSVLFFPRIDLRWDASGTLVQDTFIRLDNDATTPVDILSFYLRAEPPSACVASYRWLYNSFSLVGNQPVYWSAHTGLPLGIAPFSVFSAGMPHGCPDPDNPGGRMLRGALVVIAVNADTTSGIEINHNHLYGDATIVNYAEQSAMTYGAYAFQYIGPAASGQPTGTPGELNFDGVEFERGPGMLLGAFNPPDSTALDAAGQQVRVLSTDLALLPITLDLRQDGSNSPVDVMASVQDADGVAFDNGQHSFTLCDQLRLANFPAPNVFSFPATDAAAAHLVGSQPLLGVVERRIQFGQGPTARIERAGETLTGASGQNGMVRFDVIPIEELQPPGGGAPRGEVRASHAAPQPAPLSRASGQGVSDAPATQGNDGADDDSPLAGVTDGRGGVSSTGSLLVFPDVEATWHDLDADMVVEPEELASDTFLTITNTHVLLDVRVRITYMQGDAPLVAGGGERAHAGYNSITQTVALRPGESIFWSLARGTPGHAGALHPLRKWDELDPGTPPGRPHPFLVERRVIRGAVLAWAVLDSCEEASFNHLFGDALRIDYGRQAAAEHLPYAFRAILDIDGANLPFEGSLALDGVKYEQAGAELVMSSFASGATPLSWGGTTVVSESRQALLSLGGFLLPSFSPPTTRARFEVWNQNSTRFTGMEFCLRAFASYLGADSPSAIDYFPFGVLQTNSGRARIDGLSGGACSGGVAMPLGGVVEEIHTFSGARSPLTSSTMRLLGFESTSMSTTMLTNAECEVYTLDSDGDRVPDIYDTCPGARDWEDCDGNGIANACEPDCDNDGRPDPCATQPGGSNVFVRLNSTGTNAAFAALGPAEVAASDAFTLALWLRCEYKPTTTAILTFDNIAAADQLRFYVDPTTDTAIVDRPGLTLCQFNFRPHYGRWIHWAFTYDVASQAASCYVNGALVDQFAGTIPEVAPFNLVYVSGNSALGPSTHLRGDIDELKIYSRALAPAEVLASAAV
ncbi:MAG: LamG-like jellyroll fold domain-containing protein, partial [Phycisphaerae bacterium]